MISERIKSLLPRPLRKALSFLRQAMRWVRILMSGRPGGRDARVYYGCDRIPSINEHVHGGMIKFQRMQDYLPNSPYRFNILYIGSSSMPADWKELLWLARQKGAKVVWSQNGVGYLAWHGPGWEQFNMPMKNMLHASDYVFYQSKFCKLSADRFLGERSGPWEVLYNAVDTKIFTPPELDPDPKHLVLLNIGSAESLYRFEAAVRTVSALVKQRDDVRLIVAGKLSWNHTQRKANEEACRIIEELGISENVIMLGSYSQAEAAQIYRRTHILLHTQYNDACPTTVLEAMACGLPVVYSHSGGVPELVGKEAGIGVPAELSWERDFPPEPEALADAVLRVAENRPMYAEAARQRAVDRFDLRPWLQRHREVFENLLAK